MAIEAEKLIATFEARFSSLDKALAKARGDSSRAFGDITAAGTKAENALARIGSRGTPGLDKLNRSLGATKAQTGNIAAQFQDIAVQLQGGASPFTIAAQQAGQLSAALGTGGAGAAVRALGAGFMSLVSPVNLAVFAIVAATGYAVQYFTKVDEGASNANLTLEQQAALIQKVADRWGDAVPALKEYADQAKRLADLEDLSTASNILAEKQYDKIREKLKELSLQFVTVRGDLEAVGATDHEIRTLQTAFNELSAAVQNSTSDGKGALDVSQRLAAQFAQNGVTSVGALAEAFRTLSQEIAAASAAAGNFRVPAVEFGGTGGSQRYRSRFRPGDFGGVMPGSMDAPGRLGVDDAGVFGDFRGSNKDYLKRRALGGVRDNIDDLTDEFAEPLARLLSEFPDLKITSAHRSFEKQRQLYNDPKVGRAARPGTSLHEIGMAADLNRSDAAIRARALQLGIKFPFPGDDPGHVQLIGARNRGGGGGAAAGAGMHTDPLAKFREDPWAGIREKTGALITTNKELQESYGLVAEAGMNALQGIIGALEDGKITTQEWLQIAMTLIEQLSQIPAIGGKSGGGGGGGGALGFLGSLLGGIFHEGGVVGSGGRSRRVSALAFAGAPRMHGGGIAGDEVPAILQRGEIVTPRGGRPGGGTHVTVGLRKDGFSIYPEIVAVSRSTVRQSAPSIVQQSRKASRADFGSNAADWQMRER